MPSQIKSIKKGDRVPNLLKIIFQFLFLHQFVYMSCFHILEFLKCNPYSPFAKSQLSIPTVHLLDFWELSDSISNNTGSTSFQVVQARRDSSYMYPQSFPKPRNLTRSGVFWYSSSHQLLLAIETCIKEICF